MSYPRTQEKKWQKQCPKCNKTLYYTQKWSAKKGKLCASCAQLAIPQKHQKRPYEWLYEKFRKLARSRDIIVSGDITYEQFVKYTETPFCHYCNEPLTFHSYVPKRGESFRTNLDRKDNNGPYSVDNVVPCCWRCNNAKSDKYSYTEWYAMNSYFRNVNRHRI